MQKKTGPQKTVTQKTAIDRLNKARATLQKAVKAVNDANKKLEKTLTPAQKKAAIPKKTPQKYTMNSRPSTSPFFRKAGGAPQRKPVQKNQNNRVQRQQNNKVQKRGNQQGNNQQKRNKTGGVSIKINNRGPSG